MTTLDPIDLVLEIPHHVRSDLIDGLVPEWFRFRECDMQWAFEPWVREHFPNGKIRREASLPDHSRPDFVVWGDTWIIVLELKFRRASTADLRQLRWYLRAAYKRGFDFIGGVLVAPSFAPALTDAPDDPDVMLLPTRCTYRRLAA